MAYRTVARFPRPERLIIEISEPGRAPVRHHVRIGGIGQDDAIRFIETDEGHGRAPRRFRLDQITATIREDRTQADIRAVIRALHPSPPPSRRNRPIVGTNSFRERLRNLVIGLSLGGICVLLALGVYRVSGDSNAALGTFQIAIIAISAPLLGVALWRMRGTIGSLRALFRRRPPPR